MHQLKSRDQFLMLKISFNIKNYKFNKQKLKKNSRVSVTVLAAAPSAVVSTNFDLKDRLNAPVLTSFERFLDVIVYNLD
jgi:hypothetical protein